MGKSSSHTPDTRANHFAIQAEASCIGANPRVACKAYVQGCGPQGGGIRGPGKGALHCHICYIDFGKAECTCLKERFCRENTWRSRTLLTLMTALKHIHGRRCASHSIITTTERLRHDQNRSHGKCGIYTCYEVLRCWIDHNARTHVCRVAGTCFAGPSLMGKNKKSSQSISVKTTSKSFMACTLGATASRAACGAGAATEVTPNTTEPDLQMSCQASFTMLREALGI